MIQASNQQKPTRQQVVDDLLVALAAVDNRPIIVSSQVEDEHLEIRVKWTKNYGYLDISHLAGWIASYRLSTIEVYFLSLSVTLLVKIEYSELEPDEQDLHTNFYYKL